MQERLRAGGGASLPTAAASQRSVEAPISPAQPQRSISRRDRFSHELSVRVFIDSTFPCSVFNSRACFSLTTSEWFKLMVQCKLGAIHQRPEHVGQRLFRVAPHAPLVDVRRERSQLVV